MNLNIKKRYLIVFLVIAILTVGIYFYANKNKEINEISYRTFNEYLEKGKVKEVYLNESSKISGKLYDDSEFVTDNPRIENFKEKLLLANVDVIETTKGGVLGQILPVVFMFSGIFLV